MGTGSISSQRLSLFGDIIHKLDLHDEPTDIRQEICLDIARLMEVDFAATYRWDAKSSKSEGGWLWNMSESAERDYREYFQYRDPISSKMRAVKSAVRVNEVILFEELERTEFWNDFLQRDGLYRGINLFLFDGHRDIGDYRLWRARDRRSFDEGDIAMLNGIAPHLARALIRQNSRFEGLTARERDVAHLVSKGCRDQDIARILGISPSTVRTHLNRALEKRFCANRAELAVSVSGKSISPANLHA